MRGEDLVRLSAVLGGEDQGTVGIKAGQHPDKTMNLVDGAKIWELHATHGFPIEFSIPLLAERGYCPTWVELVRAAIKDGVNLPRLLDRLDGVIGDSYAPDVAAEIRARFTRVRW